jgi:hypothetical protein
MLKQSETCEKLCYWFRKRKSCEMQAKKLCEKGHSNSELFIELFCILVWSSLANLCLSTTLLMILSTFSWSCLFNKRFIQPLHIFSASECQMLCWAKFVPRNSILFLSCPFRILHAVYSIVTLSLWFSSCILVTLPLLRFFLHSRDPASFKILPALSWPCLF